eukprot:TRINITY_DN12199_c0_g1_i1.p2 TRINITY_DN12199_c0_g1~~TRINITY_DN12199_c0_g1_i1.p2  ORF type:complete len:127 (+),score=13.88 TRINITY_DN12199_c0_g1_i1:974-1354(+)
MPTASSTGGSSSGPPNWGSGASRDELEPAEFVDSDEMAIEHSARKSPQRRLRMARPLSRPPRVEELLTLHADAGDFFEFDAGTLGGARNRRWRRLLELKETSPPCLTASELWEGGSICMITAAAAR